MFSKNLAEYGVIFSPLKKCAKTWPGGPKGPKRFLYSVSPFKYKEETTTAGAYYRPEPIIGRSLLYVAQGPRSGDP